MCGTEGIIDKTHSSSHIGIAKTINVKLECKSVHWIVVWNGNGLLPCYMQL